MNLAFCCDIVFIFDDMGLRSEYIGAYLPKKVIVV